MTKKIIKLNADISLSKKTGKMRTKCRQLFTQSVIYIQSSSKCFNALGRCIISTVYKEAMRSCDIQTRSWSLWVFSNNSVDMHVYTVSILGKGVGNKIADRLSVKHLSAVIVINELCKWIYHIRGRCLISIVLFTAVVIKMKTSHEILAVTSETHDYINSWWWSVVLYMISLTNIIGVNRWGRRFLTIYSSSVVIYVVWQIQSVAL